MVLKKCTTSLLATFWADHVLVSENLLVLTRCTSMLVVRFLASTSTWAKGRVTLFTSKCASCHNAVHFLNISTSKSAPNLVCFADFDFEMCFAHNSEHFFEHLNSQSAPRLRCLVHFEFQACFAPKRRALFRHLLTVVRKWRVFSILTWKRASRHNGVQFFISHLPWCLRTRGFGEPTFPTLRSHKALEKTPCFATFLPFRAPASSFFWLFLFLWSSFFFSSSPPDSSHLICLICRKFDLQTSFRISSIFSPSLISYTHRPGTQAP